jgi:ribonuclease HI
VNAPATQGHAETEASGLGKHSAPNPEQTTVSSENRRKPRLHASGRIRLTPPPSSNGRYADVSLHVSGTLHVDARIDNDGYVDLEDAVFTMDWFSANGQQNA